MMVTHFEKNMDELAHFLETENDLLSQMKAREALQHLDHKEHLLKQFETISLFFKQNQESLKSLPFEKKEQLRLKLESLQEKNNENETLLQKLHDINDRILGGLMTKINQGLKPVDLYTAEGVQAKKRSSDVTLKEENITPLTLNTYL